MGSGLAFLKVYKQKTVLSICQKNNLIGAKIIVLLKVGMVWSK